MAISLSTLEKKIQSDYGNTISLKKAGKDRFRVCTPFQFNDGDYISIVLKKEKDKWILSDEGNTYMHLSLTIDYDAIFEGTRGRILSNILRSNDIKDREGELLIELDKHYGETLTSFSQAVVQIADIGYLSKERVKKTFREDFQEAISEILPNERFQFDWFDKDRDKEGLYKIDCKVNQMKKPLFIYALASEKKVCKSIISTYQFKEWGVDFTPIAIFNNREEIGKAARQQLKKVCPTQFSNLKENKEYIQKQIKELAKV